MVGLQAYYNMYYLLQEMHLTLDHGYDEPWIEEVTDASDEQHPYPHLFVDEILASLDQNLYNRTMFIQK